VDRAATLALARCARRILVKAGEGVARLEAPLAEDDVARSLVHEDGFLRVPVLLVGDLLVRGYSEELYREALD
jgi:arsenate reductase-like glutaredoxin family protein